MLFSVDTNVIARAACYCQMRGLGECIGANRRANLCHDALNKMLTNASEKGQRILSSKVIEECGDNIDRIINGNYKEFLSQPEKREKVALFENKQQNYDTMSTYKDRCLFNLRYLKNQFTKIQYEQGPHFRKTRNRIGETIRSTIANHNSPKALELRLHEYRAMLESTSEEYRRAIRESIRATYERDFAQIRHHQQKTIKGGDLHILTDIYLHLRDKRKSSCPPCTFLTMDRHLSPFLDSDQRTILSRQITDIIEGHFNITCIHPWHYLNPT